jgi:hypothetical protein
VLTEVGIALDATKGAPGLLGDIDIQQGERVLIIHVTTSEALFYNAKYSY